MSNETSNPTLPPNVPKEARCLVCGTKTQSLQPEEGCMDGATAWYSSGNYGSRIHDTCGDPTEPVLEIHVCDLCLMLHRERVLQYDRRQPPQTRVYSQWEAPKAGIDMRRRVLVVYETEDGEYHAEDHHEGRWFRSHGLTETLENSVARVIRNDQQMDEGSTIAACRRRLDNQLSQETTVSDVVRARASVFLDAIESRYPKARCWGGVQDIGFWDHTKEEVERFSAMTIHFEVKIRPGVYGEVYIGDAITQAQVTGSELTTFDTFDVDRLFAFFSKSQE